MITRHFALALPTAGLLLASSAAHAAFMAYNDLWSPVADEYAGENITTFTLPGEGTSSGLLVDYETGATPGYTLTVTGSTGPAPRIGNNGVDPNPGTDAYSEFEDILNMTGFIQGTTPGAGETDRGSVDLIFTNLFGGAPYEIVLFGERSTANDGRPTSFTISGADRFINASTSGTDFTGPADSTTIYDTAPNNATGYVARFTGIMPGTDGSVTITVADGNADNDDNWYVNGVKLSTVPVPAPTALIGLGLVGLLLQRRKSNRA
jgi:hypothetical protein